MSENEQNDIEKNKIRKVFKYIQELTKLRTPPMSDIEKYTWKLRYSNLPSYPTIEQGSCSNSGDDDSGNIVCTQS